MNPLLIGGAVAVIGGIGAYLFTAPKKPAGPPPVTPAGNQTNPVTTGPASISLPGVPLPPNVSSFAQATQQSGPAAPFAHNLYDYLKAHGLDGSAKLGGLILDFQTNHNKDKVGSTLTGPVPQNGQYDRLTSGALTIYTGDPIAADPKAPLPPVPTLGEQMTSKSPGAAANSAFNLFQYLKAHKYDPSDKNLSNLVTIFQTDVNTDPKFPGPAYGPSPKPPIIIPRLEVTGDIGPDDPKNPSPTRRALNLLFPPGAF
jgi:hypothetical protein